MSVIKINNHRSLDFRNPLPEQIDIHDIAMGLSKESRYNGHTNGAPYFVAQHSVIGAEVLYVSHGRELALEFLLHDATEAYMKDLTRDLKNMPELAGYRIIEEMVNTAICIKFKLPICMHPDVKLMDNMMLATEMRDLRNDPQDEIDAWSGGAKALPLKLLPWDSGLCYRRFTQAFQQLYLQ